MKRWAGMVALVFLVAPALGLAAPVATPDRAAVQAGIEAGDDLGSRARQVLLGARTRLDEGDAAGALEVLDAWLNGHAGRDHYLLRFERALDHLKLDQPDSALLDLRQAVKREPRFARAWLKLAEVAYGQQAYALAADGFGRGYELTPDPPLEIRYNQGVCLLLADQAEQAVLILTDLLRDHRAQAELSWYRALLSADLACAKPAALEPVLDQLVDDFSADSQAWILAGRYSASRRRYRAAAVYLTVADYLHPLTPADLNQLGDVYVACGVPAQAARCYERALAPVIEAAPRDSAAVRQRREGLDRLASTWLAAHRPDQALSALEAAVAADPDFGRGFLLMGYSAMELGLNDVARQQLQQAQTFPDQAAEAERLLAALARRHGTPRGFYYCN